MNEISMFENFHLCENFSNIYRILECSKIEDVIRKHRDKRWPHAAKKWYQQKMCQKVPRGVPRRVKATWKSLRSGTGKIRERMLLVGGSDGPTRNELRLVLNEVRLSQSRRQRTVAMQEFEKYAILCETLGRRWRRWRTGITKQKEEELLWENAKKYNCSSSNSSSNNNNL